MSEEQRSGGRSGRNDRGQAFRDGEQTGREDGRAADARELGASFEAHNSQAFGADVGEAFARENAEQAREAIKHAHRGNSRLWLVLGLVVAVAVALFLVHLFTAPKQPAGAAAAGGRGRGQNGPAAITTGETQSGDLPVYVEALGTVTPINSISVYSQVTGRVLAVRYREGQMVVKGQTLLEIDPRPYEATLAQAQGTLLHDQGVLAQARIDLARYQAAYARNAIARQLVDDQAQAVLQDEGTVATDQASIQYDKVQLSYTRIVAPISGKVGLRLVDVGNTVFSGTGATLVTITQLQPTTVVFNVSEDQLPEVQAQLRARGATLPVDAFDRSDVHKLESGRLTSLDNAVDTTTGTVKFRASFANRDNQLYPNQFVNARLLLKTLRGATLVPTAAVQHNGTQAFLYAVRPLKGGTGVFVQNVTATSNNDQVTAVEGINPNVQVATSGFDRLENGVPVHVSGQTARGPVKPAAAASAASDTSAAERERPSTREATSGSGTAPGNQSSPGTGPSNGASANGSNNSGSKAP